MNRLHLAALLMTAVAATALAQTVQRFDRVPPEGIVLQGPSQLEPARIGGRYRVLPSGSSDVPLPSWDQLQSKPPPGLYRLDRQRRHERDKELSRRQGGSLLRGVLTEVLYKNRRKKAEGR